jgi:uroporphyrinogen decarboxylase
MNHKERFFKALELREPDCVPIYDNGLDPPIVKAVLQRETGVRSTEFGEDAFSLAAGRASWESSISFRSAMNEACMKLDFDAVSAFSDYSLFNKKYRPRSVDENRFIDNWGRILQESLEGKTTYFVGGTVNTSEDLENYDPPDAFDPDVVEMMERIVKPIKEKDVVITALLHSGWHMAFQVRGGIDKLAIDFYRNPGFARKLMDKIAKADQKIAEAAIEVGVEVLFAADDYADNHGPLISPQLFREFELPNLKKFVDLGKRHGVPVLKHSDGNLYPILDDIVDSGIRGLHPIEPGAMDLKDVKERYGDRICLLGNVDCRYILPFGSEDDVRKDVRRCIDTAAKGGGFVLASSNSLHANVKVENVYAMVDETRKYGKYPLGK